MSAEPIEPTPAPAVELGELAAALAAFQAEMPTVAKSKTVRADKYSYSYATLADLSEAAMPLLSRHGLSFTTLPGAGELVGMLLHTSGQSLRASLPIGGNSPQALGSSLSYMRRYLFGCMTGLVTDDDDDGKLAGQRPRQNPAAAAGRSTASMDVDTRHRSQSTDPPPQRRRPARLPEPPRMPPATVQHPAPDGSVDVPLPATGADDDGQGPAPDDVPVAPPDKLAGTKLRAIMAGFRDVGLQGEEHRLLRLAITSAMVNRPVESTAVLTDAEGSRVLSGLSGLKEGRLTYEATEDGEVAVFVASEPPA